MPEPHERLDEAMNRRRLELRMNWREVATAAEISYEALRSIRRGDYRPSELTAHALDRALNWKPGHGIEAIYAGKQPAPAELTSKPEPTVASLAEQLALVQEALRLLLEATEHDVPGVRELLDEAEHRKTAG
jgi:DNA-binding XRE family transcriptional regulator